MNRKQLILSALVAAVVTPAASASASTYRNLCMAAASQCTYTGPDAPVLAAEVCLSRAGVITLKDQTCAADTRGYFVEHGEVVDPQTGEVAAYIPLDDRCGEAGMCSKAPPPGDSQEMPICCFYNSSGVEVCVNGNTCGGTLWFCHDGVSNDDGTVTCFQSEQYG
ncbi:hypothetical protein ENSA5_22460 [Enhygromyxa salina]|uniref:Uncharacterized protein n=1 Tax=Enhygromyxa salina TaxID=215803 RepID=A0A2S9YBL3_9BACT|nr:hypothetical protein [Enhygromyxa salina]PRQ02495.1 hypothetical protein ENSA5_22460 [Enhygromyxa salina]